MLGVITGILAAVRVVETTAVGKSTTFPIFLTESFHSFRGTAVNNVGISLTRSSSAAVGSATVPTVQTVLTSGKNAIYGIDITAVAVGLNQGGFGLISPNIATFPIQLKNNTI